MSELLPTVQAENVRRALVDYLTTTFALSDDDARDGLDRFLKDPDDGMFKGPYIRLRLPFRPAETGLAGHPRVVRGVPAVRASGRGLRAAVIQHRRSAAAAAADGGHHRNGLRQDRDLPASDR